MKHFSTFKDVIIDIAQEVYDKPDYVCSPRGSVTHEKINYSFCLTNPLECLIEKNDLIPNCYSKMRYISAELLWYFKATDKIDLIKKYTSMWSQLEVDGKVNSAYGNLIFNPQSDNNVIQFKWAIDSLLKDKDSRQAVMHFNNVSHQYSGNKDFVCTMYASLFIRENKLHLSVHMRSNDAVYGLFNDIAFFVSLQQLALLYLKNSYPNLELGHYYHTSNSMHIYDKHFKMFDLISEHGDKLKSDSLPIMNTNIFQDYDSFKLNSFLSDLYDSLIENNPIKYKNTNSNYNDFIYNNLVTYM